MNNNTKEYGYIRVSSKTQNVARQIKMMKERGIPDKRIYIDKMSERNFEKKEYKKLLAKLDQMLFYIYLRLIAWGETMKKY